MSEIGSQELGNGLDAARLRAMLELAATSDPDLRAAIARIGYPTPRQRDPGFSTLLRIILAQQVSTASAAAMWRKLEAALGREPTPESFLTLDESGTARVRFQRPQGRAPAGCVERSRPARSMSRVWPGSRRKQP